jgi:hypothetical protein
MTWSEVAELTHATQVEKFNWCSCEEQEEFPYADCPRPTITIKINCNGDEYELINYLKSVVIPALEGGYTSGHEDKYKNWIANLLGDHSERRDK